MKTKVLVPIKPQTLVSKRLRESNRVTSALDALASGSSSLVANHDARFQFEGQEFEIAHYTFIGPKGGDKPLRIALFAGIHGDEPEGTFALVRFLEFLERHPESARGYVLNVYPLCNPVGFERNQRFLGTGKDLNREFWKNSPEPEAILLEAQLKNKAFDGIIALHTDVESNGLYGFARGATIAKQLLRPALEQASQLIPINLDEQIDGFHAREGLIEDCYEGVLTSPPNSRPKPFEIILETPGQAPSFLKEAALVLSLRAILDEYQKFISFAANL